MNNVFCYFDFKHRCLKQLMHINEHILGIQKFEHRHERSAINPVKFLTKKARFPKNRYLKQHINQLSMIESINKKDVTNLLNEIKITERRVREVKNESLLKLMPGPELHQFLTLPGVDSCYHISRVTSDHVWISDEGQNLILTNTDGENLHHIDDVFDGYFFGNKVHTVSKDGELIYIDKNGNLKKLSNDLKTTTTLINSNLNSRCVYCSLITGDLLVGVYYSESRTGLVIRYNHAGQLKQIIQNDTYLKPHSVTENNNGDVIVSLCDCGYNWTWDGIVVVTDNEGDHRFTYQGNGYGIFPRGICTDALSHILVCDGLNLTVHILDKDGQFLSYLFIRPSGIFSPLSLSYDVKTHRLWVGSENNNTVCVYRFITRQTLLTDHPQINNAKDLQSDIQPTKIERQEVEECQLKLSSYSKELHSFTVTGLQNCVHISCVTSGRAWVSSYNHSLILTNTTGVTLHHVQDLCCPSDFHDLYLDFFHAGVHTVNSKGELIYISKDYNIKKLSKDMKTTSTFIQETESTWDPYCVWSSVSTGDLLVGMYSKVARYNQKGKLIQTIQHDNTGLDMFLEPHFITENNNGDIIVSDCSISMFNASGSVVVTDCEGRHRFSYTGHPPGSDLWPHGICTDDLSNILVCNRGNIHILDSSGQFLSHLELKEYSFPFSLCYDVNSRRLWIGSIFSKQLLVCSHYERQEAIKDGKSSSPNEEESLSHSRQT
ncbi:uncharacterized protein LOC128172975 [Crassostrea angulata]|uniref:uncharacterized protein LOC128172975 n=1 Tax=Magallana angulata TaxID=2784310 RepID=UPI0022B1C90E|nr:uncharacterized protein LOC128172975 [Crassostrea angulata]